MPCCVVFDFFVWLFFDICFVCTDFVWRTYNLRQSLDETDRSAHSGGSGSVMKPITSSNLFPRWSPEVPKTDNFMWPVPKTDNFKNIIGVRDLPLRDMISLGAWRMGLGCSGEILPSSSPSSPSSSPTRIWEMATSRVLLRDRSFRSARIDPSRRAIAEGYIHVKKIHIKNQISKKIGKKSETAKNRQSIQIS